MGRSKATVRFGSAVDEINRDRQSQISMAPPSPRNTPRDSRRARKTRKSATVYLSPCATRSPIRPRGVMKSPSFVRTENLRRIINDQEKRPCETTLNHERSSRP
jgi:hypothetical protein